jgi:phosphate transport system substrate-binding protein
VPELVSGAELLLDFQTVSDIYLNHIKTWDHRNISLLNPSLKLPHKNITIVYETPTSSVNYVFTAAISAMVPEFAKKVCCVCVRECVVL